jgi:hypothetical protein
MQDIETHQNYLQERYLEQVAYPDPISYFRELTSVKNPKLESVMGSLSSKMSAQQFSTFCASFMEGMAYVREKYGTQPSGVVIIDEKDSPCASGAFHSSGTGAVFITREHIQKIIDLGRSSQGKTIPFVLDANQMATMIGVEEAYHAHQFATDPVRYETLSIMQETTGVTLHDQAAYENLPIEKEAKEVVHQAMIDMGIVYTAPLKITNVTPEDMLWAQVFLKQRTTPANAIKPLVHVIAISSEGAVTQNALPEHVAAL